jgi:hypothetical protein
VSNLESTIYTVDGKEFELQHHGVKGMKWGKRKAQPQPTGPGRHGGKTAADSPEAQAAAKEARQKKVKRAVAIGAAAVGTALAAYGAKKLHDAVRDKHVQLRMQEGSRTINKALRMYGVNGCGSDFDYKKLGDWKDRVYGDHMRVVRSNARADSFGVAAKNVAGHYQSEIKGKIDSGMQQLKQKASRYKQDLEYKNKLNAATRKLKNVYRRR